MIAKGLSLITAAGALVAAPFGDGQRTRPETPPEVVAVMQAPAQAAPAQLALDFARVCDGIAGTGKPVPAACSRGPSKASLAALCEDIEETTGEVPDPACMSFQYAAPTGGGLKLATVLPGVIGAGLGAGLAAELADEPPGRSRGAN